MEAPVEALFNSLKCFQCKKYLSILPVKIYPDKSVKCGRCSSANDAGIVSKQYEHIVENLKFPCINRYEGCTELLIPKDMKIHEENCIKSNVSCPICKERFTECSLLVVEHFKEKHSERVLAEIPVILNINLKVIDEEIICLCTNSSSFTKILKIRYDYAVPGLNVDLADIGKKFLPGNFELRNMENKTIHKTCNGYSQIDLNEFPGYIVECKILFESSDNNKNKEIVSKYRIKVPVEAVDPVIQAVTLSTEKTLNIELEFSNIFMLTEDWQTSEKFFLAGTSWFFRILRNLDEDDDFIYLRCGLFKEQFAHPIENKYSFQLNGTIGIRAIEFSTAQEIKIEKAVTSIIFGKRSQESMNFKLLEVMRWKNGFNPQIADLSKSKYSIKVSLNLQLIGIYLHRKSCECFGCVPENTDD